MAGGEYHSLTSFSYWQSTQKCLVHAILFDKNNNWCHSQQGTKLDTLFHAGTFSHRCILFHLRKMVLFCLNWLSWNQTPNVTSFASYCTKFAYLLYLLDKLLKLFQLLFCRIQFPKRNEICFCSLSKALTVTDRLNASNYWKKYYYGKWNLPLIPT